MRSLLPGLLLLASLADVAPAQGPLLSYLADPATELSWASAQVYLQGGSRHRIPFLPVVNSQRAPCGTAKYSRDIRVDAPIVFVGNGIVKAGQYDAYGDLDVAGRVVLFAYDFPDEAHAALAKEVTLEERVREAAARKAAAVVLFSARQETPFPMFREEDVEAIPEIPIIAVNRASAELILAAAGVPAVPLFEKWESQGEVAPRTLIARFGLRIDGVFPRLDQTNFTFVFEKEVSRQSIEELAGANERSVNFLLDLFKGADVAWHKTFVAYFRDFDSKLFYTHHLGRGLSAAAGTFMVFDPAATDYGLAVHENTHTLLGDSWGGTSSFMTEGFARYAESMATNPGRDHDGTRSYRKQSKLFPLAGMVTMDIGGDPRTEIAYPAAGSFVGYLIASYGLEAVKNAYQLEGRDSAAKARENSWVLAFKKDLPALERDWLRWLSQ